MNATLAELPAEFIQNSRIFSEILNNNFEISRLSESGIRRLLAHLDTGSRKMLAKRGRVIEALIREGADPRTISETTVSDILGLPTRLAHLLDSLRGAKGKYTVTATEAIQKLRLRDIPNGMNTIRRVKLGDIDKVRGPDGTLKLSETSPANLLRNAKTESGEAVVPEIIKQEVENIAIAKVVRSMLDDPESVKWLEEGLVPEGYENWKTFESAFESNPVIARMFDRQNADRPGGMVAWIEPTLAKTLKNLHKEIEASSNLNHRLGRWIRQNLTMANLDTTGRNAQSAQEYLYMGGADLASGLAKLAESVVSERGDIYLLMQEHRIVGGSYIHSKSANIGGLTPAEVRASGQASTILEKGAISRATNAGLSVLSEIGLGRKSASRRVAAEVYGGIDDVARVHLALKYLTEGVPWEELGHMVDQAYPNYSKPTLGNFLVTKLEAAHIGSYFQKFTFENYRVMSHNVLKRPEKVIANMLYWQLPTLTAKSGYGMTDAEIAQTISAYDPAKNEWEVFQDYMTNTVLPFGDGSDPYVLLRGASSPVASLFNRNSPAFTGLFVGGRKGADLENPLLHWADSQLGAMFQGSPLVGILAAHLTDVDVFTKRPFSHSRDPGVVSAAERVGGGFAQLMVPGRLQKSLYAQAANAGATALAAYLAEYGPQENSPADDNLLVLSIRAAADAISPEARKLRIAKKGEDDPHTLTTRSFALNSIRMLTGLKIEKGSDGYKINRILDIVTGVSPESGGGEASKNAVDFESRYQKVDRNDPDAAEKRESNLKLFNEFSVGRGLKKRWVREQVVKLNQENFERRVHSINSVSTRFWVFKMAELSGVNPDNLLKLDMAWRVKFMMQTGNEEKLFGQLTDEGVRLMANLPDEIAHIEPILRGILIQEEGKYFTTESRIFQVLRSIEETFRSIGSGPGAIIQAREVLEGIEGGVLEEKRLQETTDRLRP